MPTPAILDIDSLLGPIPGGDPSGGSVPFALKERLDQARKEINPEDFDARDPLRPTDVKRADWSGIVSMTTEALAETSKDLMLVARLIEALTYLRGFAGLRDGFRLARRLVEEGWDRLRPPIEEPDDLEVRAAPLHWLDDTDRGARFPITIRTACLINAAAGPISWNDWHLSQSAKARISAEDVEKSVVAAPREACQIVADDLDEVLAEIQQLLALLNEKMGHAAPSLGQVRQAATDCQVLAHQILGRKGGAPVSIGDQGAEEPGDGTGEAGSSSESSLGGIIRNREQAYRKLIEIAGALEAIEPHSPIPYVIRRAVELGQLPFPALMKALITDPAVLVDMSRNLGIKELQE